MTTLSTCVRPAVVPDDVSALLSVVNEYDSDPQSPEEFLRLWKSWDNADPRLRLVAETKGQIVGTSHVRRRASMAPGSFMLHLYVRSEAIGSGIGTELAVQSEDFATANGAKRILAFVPEASDRGQKFSRNRGYACERCLFESILRVERVSDSMIGTAINHSVERGYHFATLADIGSSDENLQAYFAAQAECDLDEPGSATFGQWSFEDFERQILQAEWYRPDGAFIAFFNDQIAGVHTIGPADGNPNADMMTDFTGVRRPYRGQGVALALKMLGVRFAKSLNRTRIMTHNDSTNASMLAVNTKIGFEPRPGWLLVSKEL